MRFFLLLGQLFAYIYKHGKKATRSITMKSETIPTSTTPTILKVIDYINNHFTEKFSLEDLSKQFGISKTWLIKGFYQTTKMTVINYKIHMQINLAKNLLVTTDLSLDSIAEQTGFSSTNYFRIMFKRYMKSSPNKYRKHTHDVK
jgi:AraC-like DNA-binding protein